MIIDNNESNKQTGLEYFFPSSLPDKPKPKPITILIRRRSPNSDTWICNNCTWTGDRFFMENHPCRQNIKNNFARVQRLQNQEVAHY
jgi:hypothetical protein